MIIANHVLDDLVHCRADVGLGIGIDFFDVRREGADEDVQDFVALLLLFLGHRGLDDLIDDIERLLVANNPCEGVWGQDWVLV